MNYLKLFISVFGSLGAGFLGSLYTMGSIDTWYTTLNRPFFAPPNWVFGPVWTLLYILMGIAIYIVWTSKPKSKKVKDAKCMGERLFVIQIILNTLWSIIFFGFQDIWKAFFEIIILLYFIVLTIREFKKVSPLAGKLMYPYVAWVSFATLLNLGFALLN